MRRVLIAIAGVALLGGAPPAHAKPKPPPESGLFALVRFIEELGKHKGLTRNYELSLRGIESTHWELHHPTGGVCDPGFHEEGLQIVTFSVTQAPLVGLWIDDLRGRPVLLRSIVGGVITWDARVHVDRDVRRTVDSGPSEPTDDETCGGVGGDGGAATATDCGERGPANLEVALEWVKGSKGLRVVEWRPAKLDALYENCPGVERALKLDDLELKFSPSKFRDLKKEVRLAAKGHRERPLEGGFARTNIHYELTVAPAR